jgi:outer membrane protein assembly factor BamB
LCIPASLFAEDWPQFRGPAGQGRSAEPDSPLRWSATDNVAWKADLPGVAWSSPVICGDRVFVTTATEKGASCRVLSLDRHTGKIFWNKEVLRQAPSRKRPENSDATPTPVTDGRHVFAVFGDGSFAAVDYAGNVAWTNRTIKHFSLHGLAASPVLYQDLLIMPFDGSNPGQDKNLGFEKPWDGCFVVALDKRTGRERWRTKRGPARLAHATPLVVTVDGKDVLVSNAGDVVQAFEPLTGRRLWSLANDGSGVAPSLVSGEGLLFAASGYGNKAAVRAVVLRAAGGPPPVRWEQPKAVPMIPSPVYADGRLYQVTEKGIASCLDARTGRALWQERLGGSHSASPIYAAGRIYFLSEEGESIVVAAAPTFQVLARNLLGERCQASYAAAHGHLFIRTATRLYCLGKPGGR